MLVLGSPPNWLGAEENSFVRVASSAWTSRPTTISQRSGSTPVPALIAHLRLPRRAGTAEPPDIRIVDLGRVAATVGAGRSRRDEPLAFGEDRPVWRWLRDEIVELVGDEPYERLVDFLVTRQAEAGPEPVFLPHPQVRRRG